MVWKLGYIYQKLVGGSICSNCLPKALNHDGLPSFIAQILIIVLDQKLTSHEAFGCK